MNDGTGNDDGENVYGQTEQGHSLFYSHRLFHRFTQA